MEFNPEKNTFTLLPEESTLLRLPEGTDEWPRRDAGHLLDRISLAELDLTDVNPTTFPPERRAEAVARVTHSAQLAFGMRQLITRHIEVPDSEFDRLLDR